MAATSARESAEYSIREYVVRDWQSVCAVHDRARPHELTGATDPRAFRPMDQVARQERFFDSRTFVACEADRVVGFISTDGACITWLYVDPDEFRRGIGTLLLNRALQACGLDAWLNTMAGNDVAIAFYRKAIFEIAKSFPSDCDGYPCTCLRLALPTSRMHDANQTP